MAFLFISLAALIASMIGVGKTSYIVTLLMAAGVMAGGTYGVIFLGSVAMHVIRRVWNRKPIMEREE